MPTHIIRDLESKFKSVYKKELETIEENFDGQSRGGKKSSYIKGIHQEYRIVYLKYIVKKLDILPTLTLLESLEKAITGKVSNNQMYLEHFDILSTRTEKIKNEELKKIDKEDFEVILNGWMKIETRFWELFSKDNLKKLDLLREEQQEFLNTLTAKPFVYTDINDEFNLI